MKLMKCSLLVLLMVFWASVSQAQYLSKPGGGLPPVGSEGDCLLVSGGVATWGACPGAGSGAPTDATYIVQTANGTLSAEQALAALSTGCAGIATTTGVVATRTITGTANQITVTNGNCSGNPTLSIPTNPTLPGTTTGIFSGNITGNVTGNADTATALAANGSNCSAGSGASGVDASGAAESCTDFMEEPAGNGFLAKTGANTTASRTFNGTTNEISITNGSGASGSPVISLASTLNLSTKTVRLPNSTTLPATCTVGDIYMDTDATTGQRLYACESTNTWALQGDGGAGGGAPTGASYLVGAADGTLSAEIVVTPTDDRVMVGNGTTWEIKAVGDCTDTGGNHLNYTASSNSFSCGTSASGGATAFSAITSGTNTTATMTVGAGGSIVPTSTGVIAATVNRPTPLTVNAGNAPYTALITDFVLLCDTTAAGRTINLPAATNKILYRVKNLGANSCTIARAGSDTIDGGTSAVLTTQYEAIDVAADGTSAWSIF